MTRMSRGVIGLGSLLACLAGTAQAVPPVFDRIPADAAFVLAIPNPDALTKDLTMVSGWVGLPLPIQNVDDVLAMAGIAGAINKNGSMAVVLLEPPTPDMAGEPDMFVILPTSNYGELLKSMNAKGDGVAEGEINGEPAFFRDLGGGYALMAPKKEIAEKYKKEGGHTAAHKARMGAAGDRIADSADLVMMVNVDKFRALGEEGLKQAMDAAKENMAMMGERALNFAAVEWLSGMLLKDTRSVVAGANIDGMGVALDMAFTFNDGSRLAKLAARPGAASAMLNKLPNQPYLLAMSLDLSNPDVKAFAKDLPKGAGPAQPGSMDFAFMAANTNGEATSIGFNPGGLMSGLLARGVSYRTTTDANAYIAKMKEAMKAMKDAGVGEAVYADEAAEVGGKKVDTWEVKMNADAAGPMGAQIMMAMFGGSGGPNGYTARLANGGVIQTMSKSSDLMSAAMAAANGDGGLGGDKVTQQVGEKMPKGRVAEVYIGVKSILDSVVPLLSNFGGLQVKFDMPQNLPPVGLGLTPGDGSVVASIYLPGPTIKTAAEFYRAVESAANGGRGGDEPAPKKQDSGQPKF